MGGASMTVEADDDEERFDERLRKVANAPQPKDQPGDRKSAARSKC